MIHPISVGRALTLLAAVGLLAVPSAVEAQRPGGVVRPVTTYPGGSRVDEDPEKEVIPGGKCEGGDREVLLRELTEWDVTALATVPYAWSQGEITDSIDGVAEELEEAAGGSFDADLQPVIKVLSGRWAEGMMLWYAKFGRIQVDRTQIWTCPPPANVWVLKDELERSTPLSTGWIEVHRARLSSVTGPLYRSILDKYISEGLPQDDSPIPGG